MFLATIGDEEELNPRQREECMRRTTQSRPAHQAFLEGILLLLTSMFLLLSRLWRKKTVVPCGTGVPRVGGSTARVGDCYIWAEIEYLDSASDYREFLPSNRLS